MSGSNQLCTFRPQASQSSVTSGHHCVRERSYFHLLRKQERLKKTRKGDNYWGFLLLRTDYYYYYKNVLEAQVGYSVHAIRINRPCVELMYGGFLVVNKGFELSTNR